MLGWKSIAPPFGIPWCYTSHRICPAGIVIPFFPVLTWHYGAVSSGVETWRAETRASTTLSLILKASLSSAEISAPSLCSLIISTITLLPRRGEHWHLYGDMSIVLATNLEFNIGPSIKGNICAISCSNHQRVIERQGISGWIWTQESASSIHVLPTMVAWVPESSNILRGIPLIAHKTIHHFPMSCAMLFLVSGWQCVLLDAVAASTSGFRCWQLRMGYSWAGVPSCHTHRFRHLGQVFGLSSQLSNSSTISL